MSSTYELTIEEFDSPYVVLIGRVLVNGDDAADLAAAVRARWPRACGRLLRRHDPPVAGQFSRLGGA